MRSRAAARRPPAAATGRGHELRRHPRPARHLVENNVYSISTPKKMQVAGSIAKRAEGDGFPGVEVDGNDVFAVDEAAREAVGRRARRGSDPHRGKDVQVDGPSSDDDDRRYREREEIEAGDRRTRSPASRSTWKRPAS